MPRTIGGSRTSVSLAAMTIFGLLEDLSELWLGGNQHWPSPPSDQRRGLCHVLSEKVLGLGDLAVPLLELFWIEEADYTLPNLVAMG